MGAEDAYKMVAQQIVCEQRNAVMAKANPKVLFLFDFGVVYVLTRF